jgi:hypothetical protein
LQVRIALVITGMKGGAWSREIDRNMVQTLKNEVMVLGTKEWTREILRPNC